MFLNALESMGRHAAPAVEKLIAILERTNTPLLAYQILRVIRSCGAAADSALPVAVGCLTRFDQRDIRSEVKNILMLRGDVAVQILRKAVDDAGPGDRAQLSEMSKELGLSGGSKAKVRFENMKSIERYVALATVLAQAHCSQRELSERLQAKVESGEYADIGFSVPTLIRVLKELEPKFGGKRLVQTGKDGLMKLTTHGRNVFDQCRKDLDASKSLT